MAAVRRSSTFYRYNFKYITNIWKLNENVELVVAIIRIIREFDNFSLNLSLSLSTCGVGVHVTVKFSPIESSSVMLIHCSIVVPTVVF